MDELYAKLQIDNPDDDPKEDEFFETAPDYNDSDSFYTMNLSRPLLKAIEKMKFVHPTPIQVIIIETNESKCFIFLNLV